MSEHLYSAYGLTIASPFELPELFSAKSGGAVEPDIVIREGFIQLPQELDEQTEYFMDIGERTSILFSRRSGAFRVDAGHEIVFDPAQGATSKALRLFLMGPALSMILHQRNFMVLHASGVAIPDASGTPRVVGFLGNSGQGKSTLATALFERGYKAFADDVIAIPLRDLASSSAPIVSPGFPMFKLWPPSVQALYGDLSKLAQLQPEHPDFLRRERSSREHFQSEPLPLACLYTLEEGEAITSTRLSPKEAHLALLQHSYWVADLPPQQRMKHFHQCVELQKTVAVYRLQRPRDLGLLDAVMRVVEEDQRA